MSKRRKKLKPKDAPKSLMYQSVIADNKKGHGFEYQEGYKISELRKMGIL